MLFRRNTEANTAQKTNSLPATYKTPGGAFSILYDTMAKQTHLLIAGTTGSGKSTVVNGIIHSQLVQHSPASFQMILVDPKRVELSQYRDLPQTIYYASEKTDIREGFTIAMNIIEKRYQTMQEQGKRKYDGSHVYLIIDELADLMTTDKKAIAPQLQRIAQIGRAARVHIMACTQCPISKVLPTEIKVNFDSRLGLKTRNAQDSRNILDVSCCENLPRYGRGYFLTADGLKLVNLPLIPDAQIENVVSYWSGTNCRVS